MSLSSPQQAVIAQASRPAMVESLQRLKRYFMHARWLGENNRYSHNTVKKLESDVSSNRISGKHLAEYISASVVLHCVDGWSFLARAIGSHIAGDVGQSLHLAYYAELRGAMSLLASEGFGIFNHKHFVVKSNNACVEIPGSTGGTHKITWEILDHWVSTPAAAKLFGNSLLPGGIRLADWVSAFSGGISSTLVGADFLKTWGIDIQRLSIDRDLRNEASYRPSRVRNNSQIDPWNSAKFLEGFWEVFEPSGNSGSSQVDRFLLRIILEKTYEAIHGRRRDRRGFIAQLSATLRALALPDSVHDDWIRFLTRDLLPDDPMIVSSAKKTGSRLRWRHLHVISRSALLLRIASVSCAELLRGALVSKSDLRFWWRSLGEDRGLWDIDDEPLEFVDLWADIELSLEALSRWTDEHTAATGSRQELVSTSARELTTLSSCERIALWSTAL
jgi:hypothetical protein